jgi:hypothetical protein
MGVTSTTNKPKFEIFGITITREEHYDSNGRIRLFWVLRNEKGYIEYKTKTWEDMVLEMMWATVELNKEA